MEQHANTTTYPPPRRFWRVTFWTPDGSEHRRYIKCPYLVPTDDGHAYRRPLAPGDPDYADTMPAVSARLGALVWDGRLTSYRLSPVPSERVAAIRHRAVRWSDVEQSIAA